MSEKLQNELEEVEYLISITDEEIQEKVMKNSKFQDTEEGIKIVKEMNRLLRLQDFIKDEIELYK